MDWHDRQVEASTHSSVGTFLELPSCTSDIGLFQLRIATAYRFGGTCYHLGM